MTEKAELHVGRSGGGWVRQTEHALMPQENFTSRVGSTEATVTSAPARRRTSMMVTDSISSLPLAIGTSTLFAAAALAITAKLATADAENAGERALERRCWPTSVRLAPQTSARAARWLEAGAEAQHTC